MPNQPPQNPNQMSKPTALIVIIVIIIILGIGGYFLFTQEQGTNTNNTNITTTNTNQAVNTNTTSNTNLVTNANTNTVTNTTANTNIDTSGWKTYENEEWGYSFQYPTDAQVQDYSKYNRGVYTLDLKDDKIVPQPGGAIPISVQVFNNSVQEVKDAIENKDEGIIKWSEITVSNKNGEYAKADHDTAASEYYYIFSHMNATVLIKTTDPTYIFPTFQFN